MGMPLGQIVKEQIRPLLADVVSINLARASQIEWHYDTDRLFTICNAPDMEQVKT